MPCINNASMFNVITKNTRHVHVIWKKIWHFVKKYGMWHCTVLDPIYSSDVKLWYFRLFLKFCTSHLWCVESLWHSWCRLACKYVFIPLLNIIWRCSHTQFRVIIQIQKHTHCMSNVLAKYCSVCLCDRIAISTGIICVAPNLKEFFPV